MLTFGTVFGLVMIHVITNALEIPFGEEFMDLPLLEMHTGFNRNLLACFVEGEEKHPILADLDRKRAERPEAGQHAQMMANWVANKSFEISKFKFKFSKF